MPHVVSWSAEKDEKTRADSDAFHTPMPHVVSWPAEKDEKRERIMMFFIASWHMLFLGLRRNTKNESG